MRSYTLDIEKVVGELITNGKVRQATMFLDPKMVITATRRTFKGKILQRGNIEIILKIGKPNHAEREFIKRRKRAGEKFPVKKIQLKPLRKIK